MHNSNFFRAKLLPSSYLLKINSSLGELLSRRYFLYRRATFSKQVLSCCIKFFRIATFSIKLIFQKRYLLRKATFLQKLPFRNSYFFRKSIFRDLPFQTRYFYANVLPFHSYTFQFFPLFFHHESRDGRLDVSQDDA